MGKSKLLNTFCQSLSEERVTYLNGSCFLNRTAKPYLPMLSIVRQSCRLMFGDNAETMAAKVTDHLQDIGLDPSEDALYLLNLLGVETSRKQLAALRPEWIRTRTISAFCRLLLAHCRKRPLLLAIEDLHWIDSASEACLSSLIDNLANAPILILTTCRPAYQPPWMDKSCATDLLISPLPDRDSLSLIHAMLAPDQITAGLEQSMETTHVRATPQPTAPNSSPL